ncbi:MAG: DJ-1/PfpI family protein [Actinobacteria bacterium]|nr:DJ-1/PfpI family protein [Actinomycetota bacterium]
MARVLVPLPDRDFDVTEVAVPWKLLRDAGHEVVFATARGAAGGVPAADPLLLTGVVFGRLGAADEAAAWYAEMVTTREFRRPVLWSTIDARDFDALVLPGGHAPGMRQYLGSTDLQRKVAEFAALDRPLGAICHGVLVLARARNADGKSVLHDKRTTCLPKYLERSAFLLTAWRRGRYYRTYPAYVEAEVRAALDSPTQFVRGPRVGTARGTATDDRAAFVVEDGNYVSARWPGDAYLFARTLISKLP